VSYTSSVLQLWLELIVVLVLLKIPVAYVGWVLWWAIKAEPELGTEGGTESVNWRPWRRPPASPARPHLGAGQRARERARDGRRASRAGGIGA
jgi:hypothetical protein